MLELKDIVKVYPVADSKVTALSGVSLAFRQNEFVAILGPSGCGKTTLLNIIGGLDRYTSGDLIIDGRSTKKYKNADWDSYRNHSIGFVFQSYNLIPHQTVLSNVELALTLSGTSVHDRKKLALDALEKVGLLEQASKKPTMMSGGQMQRVAIARALVNNPSIILADEPTGALDTKTSVQIMDLLKDVAKEKLIIMVTHNPDLAEKYATRIVKLTDGAIVSDSNPPTKKELEDEKSLPKPPHTRLPFTSALRLSFNNLRTKKGRAMLTAFAGAIGIIGIALILSLSGGMNDYIHRMETDTMGSYPITIEKTVINMGFQEEGSTDSSSDSSGDSSGESKGGPMGFNLNKKEEEEVDPGEVTSKNIVEKTLKRMKNMVSKNNLHDLKNYIDNNKDKLQGATQGVEYSYSVTPQVWRESAEGKAIKVSPRSLVEGRSGYASMTMSMSSSTSTEWKQLVENKNLLENQYELLSGEWPSKEDEVAVIVGDNYKLSDFYLYTLGLMDIDHMQEIIDAANNDKKIDNPVKNIPYKDFIDKEYTVYAGSELYNKESDIYIDKSEDLEYMKKKLDSGAGIKVKVSCVLKAKDAAQISSGVGYTAALTHKLISVTKDSEIVKAQLANDKVNVFTNKEFNADESTAESLDNAAASMIGSMFGARWKQGDSHFRAAVYKGGVDAFYKIVGDTPDSPSDPVDEKPFEVSFVNWDGGPLSDAVKYNAGEKLTNIPATEPIHTEDASMKGKYYFMGWTSSAAGVIILKNSQLPPVTESTTYTATYALMPPSLTGAQVDAIIQNVSKLTPQQQAILINAAGKGSISIEELIFAGVISQEELTEFIKKNMGGQDGAAGGADVDALKEQYLQQYIQDYIAKNSGSMVQNLSQDQLKKLLGENMTIGAEDLSSMINSYSKDTPKTYDAVLEKLGYVSEDSPSSITFYPSDFDGKEVVKTFISDYNKTKSSDDKVSYTDMVGTMTKSIQDIINIITAVLVAFVSISLVVSSIMIAIITYISVLERTKEIGILRALGAAKSGITRIFNAETFIEGLLSGIFGVVFTILLDIPISNIIESLYGADNIARLPIGDSVFLIAISVILTFIAGFVPARMAAKKDPVEALRTE